MKTDNNNNSDNVNAYSGVALLLGIVLIVCSIMGGIASYYVIRDHRKKTQT